MGDKNMNIYQKLVEIRKTVPYLQKANTGKQFQYVSSSQVLTSIREMMDELGVYLECEVVDREVTVRERVSEYKGQEKVSYQFEVQLDLQFTWINADNPDEKVNKRWFSMGNDIGDNAKSVGKALTYAEKYFILKQFNVPTDKDDPDAHQDKSNSTKITPSTKTDQEQFLKDADVFAKLRGKNREQVLKALQISNVEKLNKNQLQNAQSTLSSWIKQAQEKAQQAG